MKASLQKTADNDLYVVTRRHTSMNTERPAVRKQLATLGGVIALHLTNV
jgi:hypothetical protein